MQPRPFPILVLIVALLIAKRKNGSKIFRALFSRIILAGSGGRNAVLVEAFKDSPTKVPLNNVLTASRPQFLKQHRFLSSAPNFLDALVAAYKKRLELLTETDEEMGEKNTISYVQVLSNGLDTGIAVPSVLLFFDRRRYLINCSEGFQRYVVEHKANVDKLNSILLTRATTDASGGLAGMLITMSANSAATAQELVIHGPPRTRALVDALRTYSSIDLKGGAEYRVNEFPVGYHMDPASSPDSIEDNALVKITPVVLSAPFAKARPQPPAATAATGEEEGEPAAKRQRVEGEGEGDGAAAAAAAAGAPSAPSGPPPPFCPPVSCYVMELATIPGKFLPQKASSLGVPAGPLFGKLAKGEEVTAVNGRVIKPSDVTEAETPGPIVLVIDCPNEHYLPELTGSAFLARYRPSGDAASLPSRVEAVIHLAPWDVVTRPEYTEWIKGFAAETKHMIVQHPSVSGRSMLPSSEALQAKLSELDPEAFAPPAPPPLAEGPAGDAWAKETGLSDKVMAVPNLLKYNLRPLARKGFEQPEAKERPTLDAVRADMRAQHAEWLKRAAEVKAEAAADPAAQLPEALRSLSESDGFELTFLGTGAAQPSKYRNVSGIFLDVRSGGTMLMDCGEGSVSQLIRRFGKEGALERIGRLGMVWISHFHADHHGGLAELLRVRQTHLRSKGGPIPQLLVLGPRPLFRTLQGLGQVQPLACTFVDNLHTEDRELAAMGAAALRDRKDKGGANKKGRKQRGPAQAPAAAAAEAEEVGEEDGAGNEYDNDEDGLFKDPVLNADGGMSTAPMFAADPARTAQAAAAVSAMGLAKLTSVRVFHCAHSFACVVESPKGWKIVYSGDTRPCPQLVHASRGATLLLHEATFEDGLKAEAVGKRHCITREAVRTGSEAKVYRTMLTHFSQRYPKVPKFDQSFQASTCIAFDLMTVTLSDLPRLPRLLPCLESVFKEEIKVEEKAEAAAEKQQKA